MTHASDVRERKLERAYSAGERWRSLAVRREETVRRLKTLGPGAADTPDRVEKYNEREAAKALAYLRAGVTESFFTERRIGPTLDLDDSPPNEPARLAGVPVGRIVELDANGKIRSAFATGFLIAPDILLTNHHVFASASECDNCGVQFGYEKIAGALAQGPTFTFVPGRGGIFFTDDQLDFTIVGVATPSIGGNVSLATFGSLRLIPTVGKILVGQPISIIQYPEGGPKKYGVRDNELLIGPTELDLFLQYSTDTLPGSSGSPAFNKDWEVVALHHSGVPEIRDGHIMTLTGMPWTRGMPDTDIHWVANEGARVSRICAALRLARVPADAQPVLQSLVSTFHEDFTPLPVAAGTQGNPPVTAPLRPTITPVAAGQGISITVNGPATFQFGATTAPAAVTTTPQVTVGVEKTLLFDLDYAGRKGYDRDFLDFRVSVPKIASARAGEILLAGSKPKVLTYHHYSLVMNRVRKLLMWSAVNVDYTASKRRKSRDEFGEDTWVADPRIPGILQIQGPELYDPAKKFDRGHIVRREDTAWGDTEEEEVFANSDSFHWTNCTPQHEHFNRAEFGFNGLWGGLENHIQSQVKNIGKQMSIFAGPMLDNTNDIRHDFGAGEVLVPTRFWKVLFVVEKTTGQPARLRAYGFVLDQQDAIAEFGIEKFSAGKFKTFQVRLQDISSESGVVFAAAQRHADALAAAPNEARRVAIESLDDVIL
jgi:endonuclease G